MHKVSPKHELYKKVSPNLKASMQYGHLRFNSTILLLFIYHFSIEIEFSFKLLTNCTCKFCNKLSYMSNTFY